MSLRFAGNRSPARGILRCLVIVLPWLWATVTAFALDPNRPLTVHAQRVWRSEEGLLQDTAAALLESRNGFLWIGTEAGLVRFDGATFDHFSRINTPGFVHNEIQALAETADGAIWIGTTEPGLSRFQQGAIRTFGTAEGLPDHPIRRLLRDHSGTLWAAPTEGPLLRFDGTRFHAVPSDAARLRIRALAEDPEGAIWVGTAGSGLWRLREGRLVLAALTAAEITALDIGAEGEVWVGTRTMGLLILADGRLEAPPWAKGLPARAISALLVDRQGSLWIGAEQAGLFRKSHEGPLESAGGTSGSHWTPLSLLEDSSGAMWSGTEDRGLRVIYPIPFQTVPILGADPEAPAWMVCQDSAGTVWSLTGDQTLGAVRQGHIERVPLRGRLGAPITSLWPRHAGGLWIGTRNGELYAMDQGRFHRVRWPDGPQPDTILSLYEDPRQVLWVATSHQGLLRISPDGPPLLFPAIQGVVAITGGGNLPLYLASRTQGIGILESGQVRWMGRPEGLGSNGAQSLHLDDEGSLWIGTPDGLRRYQDGTFQSFADRPGPLLLAINAILEDHSHHIWLSTAQGVFRIPRTALVRGLDGVRPIPIVAFDHHDGMPSRETNGGAQPVAWLTREGVLYFPTSRGLSRIDGNAPALPGPPLRLHILKAESDETVLSETIPVQVPPGTHRFEVYYTATSLTQANKIRFRYRLDGWEHLWNEVGDRRFSAYSNLPPGPYRFVVQAWRVDEDAPPQERSIDVYVQPFIYQRPAFWVLCGLGASAFVWWLLRLRLQQLEARSAVLAERNRMAREIHDHLAQGFTGVLLQLEAAEAKLTRMQGDPTPILTRLDHARNLAAASLQEARRSVMALSPRKPPGTDLMGALRSLADRLLAGTEIQVELAQTGTPRPLRNRLEEELLRMAQEMLTNALRHGKARWVRAVLQFERRQVRLSIEDDGQGFDPSASVAGYGMRSIRESIKQLHGHLDIDSTPGFGSRITITLPTRRWRP
jgi:signal transduction histidine kinase/ligand-binding sensor domain-containing protein